MYRLWTVFLVVLLALLSSNAKAICLMNCTPSEDNARAVFENLIRKKYNGVPFTVLSFKKVNGSNAEIGGRQVYELYFDGIFELPSGANPQCNPNAGGGNYLDQIANRPYCSGNGTRYYPPGQRIQDQGHYLTFIKTERGWLGPDGILY